MDPASVALHEAVVGEGPAGRSAGMPAELRSGEPVDLTGRFLYRGECREGRLGWVLQVVQASSGARAALRILRPELLLGEDLTQAFALAAEAARIEGASPAVSCRGHGLLELAPRPHATVPFLLQEWVEGTSLRRVMAGRGQALAPERAFHVLRQVMQGLADLHRNGAVHGDLRAETVLVASDNRARLVDCGVAPGLRRRGEALGLCSWADSRWAPPERVGATELEVSPRTDVYQLGVLVYEVFSGGRHSRWVPCEELSEMVDFMPATMDELVESCLGDVSARPSDAGEVLDRFLEVEAAFEENQRRGRPRDHGRTRELWQRAMRLAGQQRPAWGLVAAICQRLLGMRPHLMPFGKVPEGPVRDLLEEALRRLEEGRRAHLEGLLGRGAVAAAESFVDELAEDLPAVESEALRIGLERARVGMASGASELQNVSRRLFELLKSPGLHPSSRTAAVQLLEEIVLREPPASGPAARIPQVVIPGGVLGAVERWDVQGVPWTVVLGPAMRLGRGSWHEFSNHVDLRPTVDEMSESSYALLLAQTLSRAGHLEFRVGPDGLEAFCLGTHGATVDGHPLRRGDSRVLRDHGECTLATGAVTLSYRLLRNENTLQALVVEFTSGVGRGRRAALVLQRLAMKELHPQRLECGVLVPSHEGWWAEAWQDGVLVGEAPVSSGSRSLWCAEASLVLPANITVRRL